MFFAKKLSRSVFFVFLFFALEHLLEIQVGCFKINVSS